MDKHLTFAQNLADILDNKFSILGLKFGIDPIIGLIPVAGDVLPVIVGIYMAWIGWKLNLPSGKVFRILFNAALDVLIGFLPVVGDLGDFAFKSHTMNMDILKSSFSGLENRILDGTIAK